MKVTKETTMGEMLELDGGIAVILMQAGMHCVGSVFYRRISGRSMHGAWSGCRRCSGKY